ncbi:MAG: CDP-archaeol synthase [Candidatus Peribacteraceae bacterium]|nr:CDP-archaeol synthase [Candidatus Peribacteraceae bacterium]
MSALVLSALYFFLPAYIANMCPVFAGAMRLPGGTPISARLFGAHKTYRGIYSAYIGAVGMLWLQRLLQEQGIFESLRLLDYTLVNPWFFALFFGLGAAMGDLMKSFFKRRIRLPEGAPWFPLDQVDFVIGALLFLSPFILLDLPRILILLLLTPLLHFLTNVTGYLLGLKKVWW